MGVDLVMEGRNMSLFVYAELPGLWVFCTTVTERERVRYGGYLKLITVNIGRPTKYVPTKFERKTTSRPQRC